MKYEITITTTEKDNDDLTFSLDTNEGQFHIKSYGTTMNYVEFLEFAETIQEVREKFEKINSQNK